MMSYQAQAHVSNTFDKLLTLLPEEEKKRPQILLLAGETTRFRNDTDRELSFRQESNFFYLTGCNVPSAYFFASCQTDNTRLTATPRRVLLLPKPQQADIIWSIPPPEIHEAQSMFDATDINHNTSLPSLLSSTLEAHPDALIHILPGNSELYPQIPQEYLTQLSPNTSIRHQYLLPALQRTRLIKDADEIALIKKANEISSRAHETIMRVLGAAVKNKLSRGEGAGTARPLLPGEWLIEKEAEAEAIFVASCRREGAVHQAYLPIVASSTRASTLHYCCNDKDFNWGPVAPHVNNSFTSPSAHHHASEPHTSEIHPQVLLIDAGCEFNHYASDITRTMPVGNSGCFASEMANIYDLVHEMQAAAFKIIRPGVHWDTVHLECHKVLVKGFQKLGLFRKVIGDKKSGSTKEITEDDILASEVTSAFFPHGLGHSLGMDVHDVAEASKPKQNDTIPNDSIKYGKLYALLRLRLPLATGMVVTVEPGVYFHPRLVEPVLNHEFINTEGMKRYLNMGGVRIEDVIVITEDGYQNLTTVKSERSWVEGICSGEL